MPLWAALARPEQGALSRLGRWLLALACLAPLPLAELPLRELPQYEALARMLVQLHDPRYGFDAYYALDPWRGASVLPLWLWGRLAQLVGLGLASRCMVCASLLLQASGLCAVLRAQDKPVLLGLLAVPSLYACSFYLGLVPSSLSVGLAFWAIACSSRRQPSRAGQLGLCALCCALPLTHPLGLLLVLIFAAVHSSAHGGGRVLRASWPLAPLLPGAAYWTRAALHADGVAAFDRPGLATRLLRAPQLLIGGFEGQGEAWLLAATLLLYFYLSRSGLRRERPSPPTAASWALGITCLLGYLLLPASSATSTAIMQRAGAVLLAFLPALVPRAGLLATGPRGPLLLLALAASTLALHVPRLARYSAEAASLSAVLAHVPERPKLLCLTYDNQGKLARSSPYLHVGARAQAERGGFLALSRVDYAWTAPLRRRRDSQAPAPVFGSEWDPAPLQAQPHLLLFYDSVLVSGKEPREMTILMNGAFKLVAHSGMFLLYVR
jgi:hypothetical protein